MTQNEDRALENLEEWQINEVEEAIREAARGEFASSEEVQRTMEYRTRRSR